MIVDCALVMCIWRSHYRNIVSVQMYVRVCLSDSSPPRTTELRGMKFDVHRWMIAYPYLMLTHQLWKAMIIEGRQKICIYFIPG